MKKRRAEVKRVNIIYLIRATLDIRKYFMMELDIRKYFMMEVLYDEVG